MHTKEKSTLENLDFLADDVEIIETHQKHPYKIMIADDDLEVHTVTKMMLQSFEFEGKRLEFIDVFTGKETMEALQDHPDTAVLFLDVVMEDLHSGLDVVNYLRQNLHNSLTRIILRTGQPGEAPEDRIIRDYDINDYRLKTDMTVSRINTSLYTALRNYRDLCKIEKNKQGLEKIVRASAKLFRHNSMSDFFSTILQQLSTFYQEDVNILYLSDDKITSHGFVTINQTDGPNIVAATGKYEKYSGLSIRDVPELKDIYKWMRHNTSFQEINQLENGIIIKKTSKNSLNNYIYIEGNENVYDMDLINLFMTNYAIALDNFILNTMVADTQREIIITFGEVIEKHFDDTNSHILRISNMIYEFSLLNGFSYQESELLKVASTMHDVGKIAIPDAILKKPGKLTPEEFEIVKEHPVVGYQILSKSNLNILKLAAEIALYHHEKFDGTGYPEGLKGKSIPLSARMLAIIDVFDAITHRRVYKGAESVESALEYLKVNRGIHFDPALVDLFLNNYEQIIKDNL